MDGLLAYDAFEIKDLKWLTSQKHSDQSSLFTGFSRAWRASMSTPTRQKGDGTGTSQAKRPSSVVVVSGGSAGNEILDAFVAHFDKISFILPVSDNGGSSSEIIRVLGGPSLGDIRSRLIRLIPEQPDKAGIKALFSHRLPSNEDISDVAIKQEWLEIVEGSHPLWREIPPDRREAIRAFLVHFEHAILRRAQRRFNFRSGSVGNFWLAGAQLFVRSLQSAIFLFSSVGGLSSQHSVIPAINTNSLVTIAAELEDGSRIVGQNEISHPSSSSSAHDMPIGGSYTPASHLWPEREQDGGGRSGAYSRLANQSPHHPNHPTSCHSTDLRHRLLEQKAKQALDERSTRESSPRAPAGDPDEELDYDDSPGVIARTSWDITSQQDIDEGETSWDQPRREPGATFLSPSSAAARPPLNIIFSKGDEDTGYSSLPSPIHRIIYLNTYGQETYPAPSSAFMNSLATSEVLVYACGSLYTSLIPPLALSGVGNMVAMSPTLKFKFFLLNGSYDRESDGLTAVDFVRAVTDHLNGTVRHHFPGSSHSPLSASQLLPPPGDRSRPHNQFLAEDYITHLLYLEKGSIPVDIARLRDMNIAAVSIPGSRFTDSVLADAMQRIMQS